MREGGAFLLILFGLFVGYFALKGKLSCLQTAWQCAAGGATGGGGGLGLTPGGGLSLPSVPGLTVPTNPATQAPISA